jgi:AcrR family transcriptional regulator
VVESTPTGSAKPAPGNREKLLRAAIVCLRDKGYAATTARDLAAVSDANLASIGYHFGGKEALLNEAVAETTRAWAKSIEDEAFSGPPAGAEEHLRRALSATADRFAEHEPYLRSFVEAFPPALRSPELREMMAEAYGEVRAAGEAMLERLLGDEIEPEHIRTLSSMIVALCDGLILQWLLDPEAIPRSDQMIDALSMLATALAPER